MTETTPETRKEGGLERVVGRPFVKGHHRGRPKGIVDRRRLAGAMAAKAIEGKAWDVVLALLSARAWRPRFEAARLVLSYSIGAPRQTVELAGGLSDFAAELGAALAEMRLRRAALEAGRPVASLVGLPPALPAPPGDEVPTPEAPVPGGTEAER